MLMAEDPQLGSINAPFGKVTFIQIVGVCLEELQVRDMTFHICSQLEIGKFNAAI